MALYPKNNQEMLTEELFKNPTSEYRGTPFWSWNCKIEKNMLLKQIDQLKEMGMGGFHIHSRTGMATEYLGEDFMELVRECNEKAKKEKMLCWLYDEDRWPSGAAGGIVTKDIRYRQRYIVFTPWLNEEYEAGKAQFDAAIAENKKPKGYLVAKYGISLEKGFLAGYRKLNEGETLKEGEKGWYAYLELAPESPWYNNQTYANTLDPAAIQKFVQVTHEAYQREFGEDFGKSIPAMFTDEPQFIRKEFLKFADEESPVILPFTDDFVDTYKNTYGDDLLDYFPELIWELPGGEVSTARYRYHDHLSERFAAAFADTIGNWCNSHGIMLTGHMMAEQTLESQTRSVGEAMRSYRAFQLPGIDILCDRREFSTAKQAQSAAHQYGCDGVLSELYGVTNWDFDFKGHKLQGDWQAALGVTTRVHHLAWVSMEGEAKRDYPASIGYQSPWYKEYPMVEDHFSRLNTALTRGKPQVRVGVIHPIESYWLYWGPQEQTFQIRGEVENNFQNFIQWMLFGLIDFDLISEALLPSLCADAGKVPLEVGAMKYDIIMVPGNHTLRATTLDRLEAFEKAGGKVIFVGEPARYADAVKSDRARTLSERCINIPFSPSSLVESVEGVREVDVRLEDGSRSNNMFYQMRMDGDKKWLFLCHVYPGDQVYSGRYGYIDSEKRENTVIKIKGNWKPLIYNTMDGSILEYPFEIKGDETWIRKEMYPQDSLLLSLEPLKSVDEKAQSEKLTRKACFLDIKEPVSVSLSEPNVLLLDMAQYVLDDENWHPMEEILRMDKALRERLGFPQRKNHIAQPWVDKEVEAAGHIVKLKFNIYSDIDVSRPLLAVEHPENARISVNGIQIQPAVQGWFVDESIKTFEIPAIHIGKNEIMLEIPFGRKTNIEWCYLLGDFGVKVEGKHSKIIAPVRSLFFGDWTQQGLPFYAGNVTYHCELETGEGEVFAQVPKFKNPVLTVSLDGINKGRIAFSPHLLSLGSLKAGRHELQITAFGNRVNAFGTIHNCVEGYQWFGPDSWRTTGDGWSYQYQLKPMGILQTPKIWMETTVGK